VPGRLRIEIHGRLRLLSDFVDKVGPICVGSLAVGPRAHLTCARRRAGSGAACRTATSPEIRWEVSALLPLERPVRGALGQIVDRIFPRGEQEAQWQRLVWAHDDSDWPDRGCRGAHVEPSTSPRFTPR